MNANKHTIEIHVGHGAIKKLLAYCSEHQLTRMALVADNNTYAAFGQQVEQALRASNVDVNLIMLTGDEIIADEAYIFNIFHQARGDEQAFIAVGSGTINDMVRFVSHRAKAQFLSVPTAPSVDGFAAKGSSLTINRSKETVPSREPAAIFADITVLRNAPKPLIAAGFGDMLGKFTSVADWRIGHLLNDEPYSEPIAQRAVLAVQACADRAAEIGTASESGIYSLMDGLIESGLCMLAFGESRPASGAEHHISHYWETKLLRENRPGILHGMKVGVSTLQVSRYYEQIRALSPADAEACLARTTHLDRSVEIGRIRGAYGNQADKAINEQAPFLDMTPQRYTELQDRIAANWPQIQQIAATVPAPAEMARWLTLVGAPLDLNAVGISDAEMAAGFEFGHFYRARFNSVKLCRMLGLHS